MGWRSPSADLIAGIIGLLIVFGLALAGLNQLKAKRCEWFSESVKRWCNDFVKKSQPAPRAWLW
jgi:hypothetical protein